MKYVVFWDIKTPFIPHRRHTYGPPQTFTGIDVLLYMWVTFVPHKKHTYGPPPPVTGIAVLLYMWVTFVPYRKHTYMPPRSSRQCLVHTSFRCVRRLLVTANVVPSSLVLVTLIMEELRPSETWALTRATRHNIPEDGIPHSHRRENLKSYITLTGWTL
jgi:hypothetical protein